MGTEYIESYTTLWCGIFLGMGLASIFISIIAPVHRWVGIVFFFVAIGLVIATRMFLPEWMNS